MIDPARGEGQLGFWGCDCSLMFLYFDYVLDLSDATMGESSEDAKKKAKENIGVDMSQPCPSLLEGMVCSSPIYWFMCQAYLLFSYTFQLYAYVLTCLAHMFRYHMRLILF